MGLIEYPNVFSTIRSPRWGLRKFFVEAFYIKEVMYMQCQRYELMVDIRNFTRWNSHALFAGREKVAPMGLIEYPNVFSTIRSSRWGLRKIASTTF